jgi:hypothetical protein
LAGKDSGCFLPCSWFIHHDIQPPSAWFLNLRKLTKGGACCLLNYWIVMKAKARAMINHRVLVQSKWCKTEKKKKVNPAGYRTWVARFVVECASHYWRKLLRKVAMR